MEISVVFVLIFVVFIAVVLTVGLRSKQKIHNSADYSVAGRSMGAKLGTMTFVATYVSALTVVGLVGGASTTGLALVPYLFIGLALGLLLLVLFTKRIHEAGRNAESVPELLSQRFGNDRSIRVLSGATVVISYFVYLIAQLFAVGILLSAVMGFPVWAVILVVGTIFVLYTLMGGLHAVSRTDAIQLVMLIAGLLITLFIVVQRIGTSPDLRWSDAPGLSQLLGGPVPTWAIALGWTLSWSLGVACQPNYLQRVLATPDTRTARSMVGWGSAVVFWFANVPVLLIGLGIAVIRPDLSGDPALPEFLLSDAGTVAAAIAIVGLISAVMSTTDSLLHVLGVYAARDVLAPLLRITDDLRSLRMSRIFTGALGGAAVLLAAFMSFNPLPLILTFASYAVALLAAGLFVPLYGGLLWRRASRVGALASMIAGLTFGILGEWLRATGVTPIHGMVPAFVGAIVALVIGTLVSSKNVAADSPASDRPGLEGSRILGD